MFSLTTSVKADDDNHPELHIESNGAINTLGQAWAPLPTANAATDTANLAARLATSPGLVRLWPGTYAINDTLIVPAGVTLRGAGQGVTTLAYSGAGACIHFGNPDYAPPNVTTPRQYGTLSDLTITGTTAGMAGVNFTGGRRCTIERLLITGFANGAGILSAGGSWIYALRDNVINTCDIGIHLYSTADLADWQAINSATITGGEIQGCRVGIEVGDNPAPAEAKTNRVGAGLFITHIAIEGNTEYGASIAESDHTVIRECYFEHNGTGSETGAHILSRAHPNVTTSLRVRDCKSTGSTAGVSFLRVEAGIHFSVSGCNVQEGAGAGTAYGIWCASGVDTQYIKQEDNVWNPGIISPAIYQEA